MIIVDVREPFEYTGGHVPGAVLISLRQPVSRVAEFPRGVPVYVVWVSGNHSLSAADHLAAAGIDAWSVTDSTEAWLRAGRPLVRGTRAAA
ncbi:rhodanese-like domain-containing protein [Actinoplanes sp. NPDC049596]|uniref:rhodanese-like domain-containing protein n=1 Tax=unclassified Actinoplanes TaxID=2626549 RepID=UPI0034480C2B